ncbi:MAG: ATP-binding cassette domain-containing protein [Anaerolineales bacterium]|nr:ATP-binding cassette domain-containing protein [Anaerolineales bacterium]
MTEQLLSVENLSKNFDRLPVLKNVSFSIRKGEVVGLVGRQGAGKSTLLHTLSGTIPPSYGTIKLDGINRHFANQIEAQKEGIETVYQTSNLLNRFDFSSQVSLDKETGVEITRHTSGLVEHFNVTQNILLGREITKFPFLGVIDQDTMVETAQNLLAEFDLPKSMAIEQIRNLSDEQRQVVLLLRMLHRPCKLLLLDDVIPILSFNRQGILLEKIRDLAAQGTSVLISSDDLTHLFTVTDRIIVLYEGQLVADRKTSESTPREIVELIVGSEGHEQVSPLIWAMESYHTAQKQTEELRLKQATLQQSLNARDSINRQLAERLSNQLSALDHLNAALHATQRRLITERENERKALARELHDQIIQDLLGLNYHLESVEGLAESPEQQNEISFIRGGIRDVIGELRQMCSDLRPPTIDHHGLSAAIDSLVHEWLDRNEVQLQLEIDPSLGRMPEMIELSIFRIVQEGLNNVRKHSEAKHVRLSLQRTSSTNLLIRLEDDGRGLPKPVDLAALSADKHFGLVGISERVALLGGTINIESSKGNGTILQIEIPSPYPLVA